MASIQINRGTAQQINSTPITDGLINFDTTNNAIFLDNQNTREMFSNASDANVQDTADSTLSNIKIKGHTYSAVGSFNGRSGQVSPQADDYAIEDITPTNAQDGQVPVAREDEHGNISFEMEDIVIDIPVEDLNDVDISNVQNGQVLKYNSTSGNWENANDDTGVDELSELADTNITTPTNGQVLKYNTTSQKWENANEDTGVQDLEDLENVVINNPENSQVLKYDSATQTWKNANESGGGGGGASSLSELSDVALASLTNGQILKYDSSTGKWNNEDESAGGHIIKNNSGTAMTERTNLKFGSYLKVTDDSAGDATVVSDEYTEITWSAYQALTDEQRANNKYIITDYPTPTPSSGGHTIQDASGVDLAQEDTLQFAGYLKASDDSTNGKTVIDDTPIPISWEAYQALSDAQRSGNKYLISGYPSPSQSGVSSFNGRTGAVTPTANDYTIGDILPTSATNGQIPVARSDGQGGMHLVMENAPSGSMTIRTFNIASSQWKTNTDATTSTDYPYVCEVGVTPINMTAPDFPIYQWEDPTFPTTVKERIFELAEDNNVDLSTGYYFIMCNYDGSMDNYSGIIVKSANAIIGEVDTLNSMFQIEIPNVNGYANYYEFTIDFNDTDTFNEVQQQTENPYELSANYSASRDTVNLVFTGYNYLSNADIVDAVDSTFKIIVNDDSRIPKNIYANDSMPIWQMNGVGNLPTSTEKESIDMITEGWFDMDGIKLYAVDEPSVNLVLAVKGE